MPKRHASVVSVPTLCSLQDANRLIRLIVVDERVSRCTNLQAMYAVVMDAVWTPSDLCQQVVAAFEALCDAAYLMKLDIQHDPEGPRRDRAVALRDALDASFVAPLNDEGLSLADWCLERHPVVEWTVVHGRLMEQFARRPGVLVKALEHYQKQHLAALLKGCEFSGAHDAPPPS